MLADSTHTGRGGQLLRDQGGDADTIGTYRLVTACTR